jgi:hypothetical protein
VDGRGAEQQRLARKRVEPHAPEAYGSDLALL